MTPRREILAEDVVCYLGDCRDSLPSIHGPIAIVSDPPYGQRINTNVASGKGGREYRCGAEGGGMKVIDGNARRKSGGGLHTTGWAVQWPDGIVGDDEPFDPSEWLKITSLCLFWGAHRFAHKLPEGSWLVWDKVPTGKIRDQGDGEAAWINGKPQPMRIFRLLWDGVCVGSAARDEVTAGQQRVHPTQKPVVLMEWCLEQMRLQRDVTIVDPYMGAGSTGIAAVRRGHNFVGMEIVPLYFETACRRISEALRQPDMFIEKPKLPKQESWHDMWLNPHV